MLKHGKYDDICAQAQTAAQAKGIILIVFDGKLGHGFSGDLPDAMFPAVVAFLRKTADDIVREYPDQFPK